MGRGHKRDRKDGKKGHRQLRDREKRARTEAEEDESMMDMDPADDVSVVGTRKSQLMLDGPFDFAANFQTYLISFSFLGTLATATAVETPEVPEVKIIPASDAITLKGHTADVFVCSWNPASPSLLASGYVLYQGFIQVQGGKQDR